LDWKGDSFAAEAVRAEETKMPTPLTEKISEFTVRRLSNYFRILSDLERRGVLTVSSARLAELGGITSAQVRKDLSYFGNFGMFMRAYAYILMHGAEGLRQNAFHAVLNANYLLSRVKHMLPVPQGDRCMHEFVATAGRLKKERGVSAMDVAKRLLDYGFHAPTVYFPLTVPESMMIEPTETESRETLDAFAEALFRITEEPPDLLHEAPHTTVTSRPDEVQAARRPVLKWTPT